MMIKSKFHFRVYHTSKSCSSACGANGKITSGPVLGSRSVKIFPEFTVGEALFLSVPAVTLTELSLNVDTCKRKLIKKYFDIINYIKSILFMISIKKKWFSFTKKSLNYQLHI